MAFHAGVVTLHTKITITQNTRAREGAQRTLRLTRPVTLSDTCGEGGRRMGAGGAKGVRNALRLRAAVMPSNNAAHSDVCTCEVLVAKMPHTAQAGHCWHVRQRWMGTGVACLAEAVVGQVQLREVRHVLHLPSPSGGRRTPGEAIRVCSPGEASAFRGCRVRRHARHPPHSCGPAAAALGSHSGQAKRCAHAARAVRAARRRECCPRGTGKYTVDSAVGCFAGDVRREDGVTSMGKASMPSPDRSSARFSRACEGTPFSLPRAFKYEAILDPFLKQGLLKSSLKQGLFKSFLK
jgi:hypothetical protein